MLWFLSVLFFSCFALYGLFVAISLRLSIKHVATRHHTEKICGKGNTVEQIFKKSQESPIIFGI